MSEYSPNAAPYSPETVALGLQIRDLSLRLLPPEAAESDQRRIWCPYWSHEYYVSIERLQLSPLMPGRILVDVRERVPFTTHDIGMTLSLDKDTGDINFYTFEDSHGRSYDVPVDELADMQKQFMFEADPLRLESMLATMRYVSGVWE